MVAELTKHIQTTSLTVPGYDLLRVIGSGSYGEVYLARSSSGDLRAVKITYRDRVKNEEAFDREYRGLSVFCRIPRMHGLICIYAVGRDDSRGIFYAVMELADDEQSGRAVNPETYRPATLASLLAAHIALPLKDCLNFAIILATALRSLQEHNLAHRDIKPSNVLLIGGKPVLADVGLVADMRDIRSVVGTPGYAPPENHGTPQGDVYSLGRLLYVTSTGRNVNETGFAPRDEADTDSPGFAEWLRILRKACADRPADRYGSAKAMLADLIMLKTEISQSWLKSRRFWLAFLFAILTIFTILNFTMFLHQSAMEAEVRTRAFIYKMKAADQEHEKMKNISKGSSNEVSQINGTSAKTNVNSRFKMKISERVDTLIAGTLNGTQKRKTMKLAQGRVYVVDGEYFVPEGMLLEIEAGAALRFNAGALLSVGGLLLARGNPADPVRMIGSENGAGYWKGITISGKEQSSIQGITVTDADVGIYVNNGKASISDSLVRGNNTGIKVNGRDSSTLIENCIIDRNISHGVDIYSAKVQLNSCTISENGGFGIWGNYYPQPSLSRTKVTGNAQGGIYGRLYSGVVTAHDSIICGNGDSDVVHLCDGDWDFSRCWWGAENTAVLKKSDTANLDCIQDSLDGKGNGRVRVSGFLEAEPADCGARLDGVLSQEQGLSVNPIFPANSAETPADGLSLSQLASKKKIYLSDLTEIRANVGSWQLMKGILNTWEVNGETVGHGLFAHAPSEVVFNINGLGMQFLKGSVGFGRVNVNSSAQFKIFGDSKLLWKSRVLKQGPRAGESMIEKFSVSVRSVRNLRLEVDDLGDRNSDHSIWIDPVLLVDEAFLDPTR